MCEAFSNQVAHDLIRSGKIDYTRGKGISSRNMLFARDRTQPNSPNVSRFETNGGSCRNIKSFTISLSTIERQSGIGFDEVIV